MRLWMRGCVLCACLCGLRVVVCVHSYLRFGMVIPMPQLVDCTVTQGSVTHTWSQYGFGKFSDWITTFKAAPATITIASGVHFNKELCLQCAFACERR
jgi:hypothetical protein